MNTNTKSNSKLNNDINDDNNNVDNHTTKYEPVQLCNDNECYGCFLLENNCGGENQMEHFDGCLSSHFTETNPFINELEINTIEDSSGNKCVDCNNNLIMCEECEKKDDIRRDNMYISFTINKY